MRTHGIRTPGTIGPSVRPNNAHKDKNGIEFGRILEQSRRNVRFSAHAKSRLVSRNITMTPEMTAKLDKAVEGARAKGSRDSLILLSDMAFIVNIPNRTVVTAMDGNSMKDNVVTNIDSTVIAD
ncbi:MAG: flagellar biosynthesis protein [Chitinivibrionales bacterium]|nr:flagellar biosynthesis protein [Chitinivibrionales bacterium]